MSAELQCRNLILVINLLTITSLNVAQWLALQSSTTAVEGRFPGRESIYLLFISDVVNFLFKTSGGETQGLILLFL